MNIKQHNKSESFYSMGNRDGRNFAPMKARESFESGAAYLSYRNGYNDGMDGIYEADFFNNVSSDFCVILPRG